MVSLSLSYSVAKRKTAAAMQTDSLSFAPTWLQTVRLACISTDLCSKRALRGFDLKKTAISYSFFTFQLSRIGIFFYGVLNKEYGRLKDKYI